MRNAIISDRLYDRYLQFAKDCTKLSKQLPKSKESKVFGTQLVRSSSSVGSNYIEALEATSRKDFVYRLRVSRKEARESLHWLNLLESNNPGMKDQIASLKKECGEIIKILSKTIITAEKKMENVK